MTKLFSLLLILSSLQVLSQNQRIVITGKVIHPTAKTIKLSINDLFKETITKTCKLKKDGTFQFVYNQKYPHDNNICYNNKSHRFFSAPNDSLQLIIDNNKPTFAGSNSLLNNELSSFKIRDDKYWLAMQVIKAQQKMTPNEYKNELNMLLTQSNDLLTAYYKKHNSSPKLQQWTQYYYTMRTYHDLVQYCFVNKDKKIPDNYFDFIVESNIFRTNPSSQEIKSSSSFDKNAFMCSMTNDFVSQFFILLSEQTVKARPEIKGKNKRLELIINEVTKKVNDEMREVFITYLFQWLIDMKQFAMVKKHYSTFFEHVKNETMRKLITNELASSLKKANSNTHDQYLAYYSNDKIIGSLIDSIMSKNKGRLIYIDFWSPWCSPCLGDIKSMKKLKAKYSDKDLATVYLCVNVKQEVWKSNIKKLAIKGDHYLLNNDQYNILQQLFQIKGIPHYILVDTKGKIVHKNALPPCEVYNTTKFEELLKQCK